MTEDEVFRGVCDLVAAGEYLDGMLGIPGARLTGGGAFVGNQRMYVRNSPEYWRRAQQGSFKSFHRSCRQPEMLSRPRSVPSAIRSLPSFVVCTSRSATADLDPATSLFPVCTWGCGILSFVDCAGTEATMWGWDPNPAPQDDISKALFPEDLTFTDWLARWVVGRLYQPVLIEDADTGEWRGATQEEKAAWMTEQ
jgi:hypothetical protein